MIDKASLKESQNRYLCEAAGDRKLSIFQILLANSTGRPTATLIEQTNQIYDAFYK